MFAEVVSCLHLSEEKDVRDVIKHVGLKVNHHMVCLLAICTGLIEL